MRPTGSRLARPPALATVYWSVPSQDVRERVRQIPGVTLRGSSVIASVDAAPEVEAVLLAPGLRSDARPRDFDIGALSPSAFPWQKEDAALLASGQKVGILASCGTGKTGTILMAARALHASHVLICTRAMGREVYARDSLWAWPGVKVAIVVGTGRASKASDAIRKRSEKGLQRLRDKGADVHVFGSVADAWASATVVVVGWEVLVHHLDSILDRAWDVAIADESHMMKARKRESRGAVESVQEGNAEAVAGFGASPFLHRLNRTAAALRIARHVPVCWLATATPVRDRVRDLYSQLAFVAPASAGKEWNWMHYFASARPGRYGGLDTSGTSHLADLKNRVRFLFAARTRKTIAHLLPAKRREVLRVPNDAAEFVRPRDIEDALAAAAELKKPELLTRVVEALAGSEKLVVVGNRKVWARQMAASIESGLRRDLRVKRLLWLRVLTGDSDVAARTALAREFMEVPGPACAVATIDAVSESIDLHDADRVLVAALPYTPGQLMQLEGRFSRLGGHRPVTIEYLVAEGTIDEEVEELLLSKLAAVEEAGAHTEDERLMLPTEAESVEALSAWLRKSWDAAAKASAREIA